MTVRVHLRSGPLKLQKCHPSRHGCQRYDQIERKRKLRRKGPRPMYQRMLPRPPPSGICYCGSDDLHNAGDKKHGQHVECCACLNKYRWTEL